LLFFHSYRKILEGNTRFGTLLNGKQSSNGCNGDSPTSVFKRTALFSMMSNADLFDSPKDPDVHLTLEKLNFLLGQYAGCRFTKLRQAENDSLELRVQPVGGGGTFNFDGLSSGQKDIITTLFLIWYEKRIQPKVVLIVEPDLHLNSQWHRTFINSLVELAPQNQYIIASHSATIMDSVNRNRRILLQKDKETAQ
jgi:predicted ATPase